MKYKLETINGKGCDDYDTTAASGTDDTDIARR